MCLVGARNKKQIASHSCWPANTMWRKCFYSDTRRVLAPAPKVLGSDIKTHLKFRFCLHAILKERGAMYKVEVDWLPPKPTSCMGVPRKNHCPPSIDFQSGHGSCDSNRTHVSDQHCHSPCILHGTYHLKGRDGTQAIGMYLQLLLQYSAKSMVPVASSSMRRQRRWGRPGHSGRNPPKRV